VNALIVLDLGKFAYDDLPHILRDTAKHHREGTPGGYDVTAPAFLELVADQIEAQTKPPRIPEPGLWGVVEASSKHFGGRREYIRTRKEKGSLLIEARWYGKHGYADWDDLIEPALIREGVES